MSSEHRIRIIEELLQTVLDQIETDKSTLGDLYMDLTRIEASIARAETLVAGAVELINTLSAGPDAAALNALAERIDALSEMLETVVAPAPVV